MTGQAPTPSPDAYVRGARAEDAPAMAAVTVAAWQGPYANLLPAGALASLHAADVAEQWRLSVSGTTSARHGVLVALEGAAVIGYVVVAPTADPDADSSEGIGEIVDLVVDAAHQRRGHGSRLLAAAVDHQRGAGVTRLRTWCLAQDDARAAFLRSAGFEPDGATRTLDADDGSAGVHQLRWGGVL